jgi:DNA polymerase III subunit delta'
MSAFEAIAGQEAAVRTLERALSADRLASAYLFEGPGGVGKQRTALALATARVAGSDASVARRIHEGRHPDVRIVPPRDEGARNLPVELLRSDILPFAQFAPFEASASFIVFPEADVSFPPTHPEAANALLKTLEEPRRGVHFVLLAERPDRLLPTIRSRCQSLRFHRLSRPVLEQILEEHGTDRSRRDEAVALADGRADRALALAREDDAGSLLEAALQVDAAVASGAPGTMADAAEALAKSDRLPLVLDTLATFYRDVACASLGLSDAELTFRHAASAVRGRARTVVAAQAAHRVERIQDALAAIEHNANPHIAMDALLSSL